MSQNAISQGGERHACDHPDLNGRHDFPSTNTESSETENLISVSRYQGLEEPSRFGKRTGAQVYVHGNLEQAIRNTFCLRFCFVQADMSQLRICKQAIWNLPARCHAVDAIQIGMHNAKIVDTD